MSKIERFSIKELIKLHGEEFQPGRPSNTRATSLRNILNRNHPGTSWTLDQVQETIVKNIRNTGVYINGSYAGDYVNMLAGILNNSKNRPFPLSDEWNPKREYSPLGISFLTRGIIGPDEVYPLFTQGIDRIRGDSFVESLQDQKGPAYFAASCFFSGEPTSDEITSYLIENYNPELFQKLSQAVQYLIIKNLLYGREPQFIRHRLESLVPKIPEAETGIAIVQIGEQKTKDYLAVYLPLFEQFINSKKAQLLVFDNNPAYKGKARPSNTGDHDGRFDSGYDPCIDPLFD